MNRRNRFLDFYCEKNCGAKRKGRHPSTGHAWIALMCLRTFFPGDRRNVKPHCGRRVCPKGEIPWEGCEYRVSLYIIRGIMFLQNMVNQPMFFCTLPGGGKRQHSAPHPLLTLPSKMNAYRSNTAILFLVISWHQRKDFLSSPGTETTTDHTCLSPPPSHVVGSWPRFSHTG